MSFCIFQITSFAQGTLWCSQKFFWGRGKGEKFPCFQCGKWKICKLTEWKNQEKLQNPKGNVFSFLFRAALSLWPCVGTAERKLCLQMGSLWLLGSCSQHSCQGVSDTEHGQCHQGWLRVRCQGSCSLWLQTFPAAALLWTGHSCCSQCAPGCPSTLGVRLVGVGGSEECSHIPIQFQSQIPADLAAQGNLSLPWVFAFKGSVLYFTKIPSLCVLRLRVFGAQSSFQRHFGTALGVRAFAEVLQGDSCLISMDRVAGPESG